MIEHQRAERALPGPDLVEERQGTRPAVERAYALAQKINVAPTITTQPVDKNVNQTSNAVFSVMATGTPAPSYQWRKNGVNLVNGGNVSGATSASLAVSGVLNADEGSYSVMVTNPAGFEVSRDAILAVIDPVISTPPASRINNAGTEATFSVGVTGTPTLSYQWYKGPGSPGTALSDGSNVAGARTRELNLLSVASSVRFNRARSASTSGSPVGPSTPPFQLRLSLVPSWLPSPLASLCLWL